MKKAILRIFTLVLTLTLLLTGTLTGAVKANAMDSIRYTDLFYGYASSYLDSQALQWHHEAVDDILFQVYNDYCDSDDFKWTAVKDGIKAATNLSEFYKLMSDTYGDTDYQFEEAMDKANLKLAAKLLDCSANYAMADQVMEGMQAIQNICEIFEEGYDPATMEPMDVFYNFLELCRQYQIFAGLGDEAVRGVGSELLEPTKVDVVLSYVSDEYEAVKTIAVGMMLENLRMEVIDDIIANAPTDSYIYQGMSDLKNQLRNGFVSYFFDNYVNDKIMDEINDKAVSKLTEFALGSLASCFSAVSTLLNVAAFVVFDVIFDVPGVDDLTVQKVLDEYSTDLYLMLRNTKIPQFDKQFDSSAVGLYEAVFNTYLAASEAALDASEDLALDSNKAELKDVADTWGTLSYDDYIYDIKQTIATQDVQERQLKIIDGWNIDGNTQFHEASDEVEEGYAYLFDGKFRANVNVTGNYTLQEDSLHIAGDLKVSARSVTLTVPAGKTLQVDGDLIVNYSSATSSSYYSTLNLAGTLRVTGNFTVDYYGYFSTGETGTLYVAGDYAVNTSRQPYSCGHVIFNGSQQQNVYGLYALNVTVTNPQGIRYGSIANVSGHYALNANPLEVGNFWTYFYSTTTFDGSDYTLVKPGGSSVTLGTDVKANVIIDKRSQELTVAEGTDYTIDGNLLANQTEYNSSSYYSTLNLAGTLRVTGNFTIDSCGYFTTGETGTLYVAGDYAVNTSRQPYSCGHVIFNGSQQQNVYGLYALNVTVTNPQGIRYGSIANVSGHYALNANPLEVGNFWTYFYSTTTFDGSDYTLVKPGGSSVTLGTDVKANVIIDKRSQELTVAEGADFTIDGNLLANQTEYNSSSYYSTLNLAGTLRVTGSFTIDTCGYFTTGETGTLYVAGDYAVNTSRQPNSCGHVIFNGSQQQNVYGLNALDVTVTNSQGIRYGSNANVSGHYALNGNPLEVGNFWTWFYSTTTFDGSDYTLVKPSGSSVTLGTDVKADVVVYKDSQELIVAEGTDYTIDGNLLINQSDSNKSYYYSYLVLKGILRVTGDFTVSTYGRLAPAATGQMYVSGDYSVYDYNGTDFTLVMDGEQLQNAYYVRCSTLILENGSEEGVHFNAVYVSELFDHKGNVFTLSGSNSFVDYDGDGILDHEDPAPTIHKDSVKEGAVHIYANGACVGICSSLAEALESYDPTTQYLQLTTDLYAAAALSGDLYIDLNGNDLSGVLETGEHKVYALDSTTDSFNCDQVGKFTCVDETGTAVIPVFSWQAAQDVVGRAMCYVSLEEDGAYSFHRYSLEITHISLKPNTVSLGYKAVFAGDLMVQQHMDTFGFSLWLENGPVVTRQMDGAQFVNMRTVSLRVANYDVDSFGETPLYAQVFMCIDGNELYSPEQMTTMQTVVEAINDNAANYSAEQLSAVEAMIRMFERPMQWRVENILSRENG